MFEAEADGLAELRETGEVRVPEVIDCGIMNGEAYIDLEPLDLELPSQAAQGLFGEQLARLHGHTQSQFGWFRDNTIGMTPQHNPPGSDWVEFFRDHRLGFQVELAIENGFGADVAELG